MMGKGFKDEMTLSHKYSKNAVNFHNMYYKKGYIRRDPDLSPIAKSFWTGSYPSAVGECGKPCRKVCNWKKKLVKISFETLSTVKAKAILFVEWLFAIFHL